MSISFMAFGASYQEDLLIRALFSVPRTKRIPGLVARELGT